VSKTTLSNFLGTMFDCKRGKEKEESPWSSWKAVARDQGSISLAGKGGGTNRGSVREERGGEGECVHTRHGGLFPIAGLQTHDGAETRGGTTKACGCIAPRCEEKGLDAKGKRRLRAGEDYRGEKRGGSLPRGGGGMLLVASRRTPGHREKKREEKQLGIEKKGEKQSDAGGGCLRTGI